MRLTARRDARGSAPPAPTSRPRPRRSRRRSPTGSRRCDGVRQPPRRLVHVGQRRRIRHQRADGGIEEHRHVVEPHAARREHAPQQLRQAVLLADGDGVAWLAPVPASRCQRLPRAELRRRRETRRRAAVLRLRSDAHLPNCRHVRAAPAPIRPYGVNAPSSAPPQARPGRTALSTAEARLFGLGRYGRGAV